MLPPKLFGLVPPRRAHCASPAMRVDIGVLAGLRDSPFRTENGRRRALRAARRFKSRRPRTVKAAPYDLGAGLIAKCYLKRFCAVRDEGSRSAKRGDGQRGRAAAGRGTVVKVA